MEGVGAGEGAVRLLLLKPHRKIVSPRWIAATSFLAIPPATASLP